MKGKPPSRYFFHDGIKYILTGNERLAMSHFHELRAHVNLLKMTNTQNLPIIFGDKYFDDGTFAHFQFIHGRDQVDVIAPSYAISSKKEEEEIIEISQEMIVPTIITYNAAGEFIGFTICKNGTFEPPYQFFPNETDFPYSRWFTDREASLTDNTDYPQNNLLLSKNGEEAIYLITETGEKPQSSIDFDYLAGSPPQAFMYWTIVDGPIKVTCPDNLCFRYFDLSATVGVGSRLWTTELWGNIIPSLDSTQTYSATGGYKAADYVSGFPCSLADDYMALAENLSRDPSGYIEARPPGFIQGLLQSWKDHLIEFPGYIDSITANRDDVTHFAACYTMEDRVFEQYENRDFNFCDYGPLTETTETTKDTFTLYLNVDSREHQIGFVDTDADGMWFQFEGGMRYYGKAKEDGTWLARTLCAEQKWYYHSDPVEFSYHHYSSVNDTVTSTKFEDPLGEWRHKIANVTYQGEPVYGTGEVILCRYVDGYKEKIKIR